MTSGVSFYDVLEFIGEGNIKFCFQQREVGLDIYLWGPYAWVPGALAIAAVTVFALSIFHVVPRRAHAIPILLGLGVVAFALGAVGTYGAAASFLAAGDGDTPRIFLEGAGAVPVARSQQAAVLSLPLYVGAATLIGAVGASVFLMLFGGSERGTRKRDGKEAGRNR